jgi:hypothetical protein
MTLMFFGHVSDDQLAVKQNVDVCRMIFIRQVCDDQSPF